MLRSGLATWLQESAIKLSSLASPEVALDPRPDRSGLLTIVAAMIAEVCSMTITSTLDPAKNHRTTSPASSDAVRAPKHAASSSGKYGKYRTTICLTRASYCAWVGQAERIVVIDQDLGQSGASAVRSRGVSASSRRGRDLAMWAW